MFSVPTIVDLLSFALEFHGFANVENSYIGVIGLDHNLNCVLCGVGFLVVFPA